MVVWWAVGLGAIILGGIAVDSFNKGRLSIPVIDELTQAAESAAEAIDSFAQLFTIAMRPAFNEEGKLSKHKALQIWASTPALQLAAVLAIGAPVGAAALLSTPKIIESIPNAMKTLSEIEMPRLTPKQRKNLKIALIGSTAVSGYWAFNQFNLWRYLAQNQSLYRHTIPQGVLNYIEAQTAAQETDWETYRLPEVRPTP